MLYGTRTARTRAADTEILLNYFDGETHWQYADTDTYGDTAYLAEPAQVYDGRQGTYVNGYELLMLPVDSAADVPNPSRLATIADNDIPWQGELLTTPTDPADIAERGTLL